MTFMFNTLLSPAKQGVGSKLVGSKQVRWDYLFSFFIKLKADEWRIGDAYCRTPWYIIGILFNTVDYLHLNMSVYFFYLIQQISLVTCYPA